LVIERGRKAFRGEFPLTVLDFPQIPDSISIYELLSFINEEGTTSKAELGKRGLVVFFRFYGNALYAQRGLARLIYLKLIVPLFS
jgi:hypothetical protein